MRKCTLRSAGLTQRVTGERVTNASVMTAVQLSHRVPDRQALPLSMPYGVLPCPMVSRYVYRWGVLFEAADSGSGSYPARSVGGISGRLRVGPPVCSDRSWRLTQPPTVHSLSSA